MGFILLAVFFTAMFYVIRFFWRAKNRENRKYDIQNDIHDLHADQEADELQKELDDMEKDDER